MVSKPLSIQVVPRIFFMLLLSVSFLTSGVGAMGAMLQICPATMGPMDETIASQAAAKKCPCCQGAQNVPSTAMKTGCGGRTGPSTAVSNSSTERSVIAFGPFPEGVALSSFHEKDTSGKEVLSGRQTPYLLNLTLLC
jgi:hypothetical protein